MDVIECTRMPTPSIQTAPLQTPRKALVAPVVHEPVETQHSKARWPIASNGKLVDVIECTPTRLRPQRHQPAQNVAIKENGKFVSRISVSFDCLSD